MTGIGLLILITLAVLFIVFATAKLKLQPFLSLLIAAFGLAILAGIPLTDVAGTVNDGFGGLMGSIGLVIAFGTIIGVILERSGAALRMAEVVLRSVGVTRAERSKRIIAACVSVPGVCGYVYGVY